ncbi:MAG: hypothetical protein UY18_C0050G0007 [Microgenomates group bacterium GW2011_GWF2_47_9]|nr:MAG: hypothetical protein UY18_C0050G0007 [Microgenomates group bacterium GW2011_GWF2_47_9]
MESEFFDLFETAQERQVYLRVELGYTRTTDWCLFISDATGGKSKQLCTFQGCDRKLIFAQAYARLAKWLNENHGGY